jgi:hypothetical protein
MVVVAQEDILLAVHHLLAQHLSQLAAAQAHIPTTAQQPELLQI